MGQPLQVRTTQGGITTMEEVSPNQRNYPSNEERARVIEVEDANVYAVVESPCVQVYRIR